MGVQDEYLRNFTVLLTERGVVPLTDPVEISIYNSLCDGMKRPSDMAKEMKIPSSSLHFVLDKMVKAGVIVRSKPDSDKKSVYYSNLARKIAGSCVSDEESAKASEEAFSNPSGYYTGLSSVANMLDKYTREIGLDMTEMRTNYASELADALSDSIGKGNLEDKIFEIKEVFTKLTGFKFSIFGMNPLKLVFEGDIEMVSQIDMLSQFVLRAVENATGRCYAVVDVNRFNREDSARVMVVFDRKDRVAEPYFNSSLPQPSTVNRFMMVELNGTAGLMTSDVQIDIVDTIYERPLCITDIVGRISAPRSTITSNLLRMVEEGVVTVFYSESGSAYYGLSCSILMKRCRNIDRDSTEINELMSGIAAKEGSFMEGYLLHTLTALKKLGFDTDYMMVVLGARYMRSAGRTVPKDFDAYFGKMSEIAQAIGLSLNVVSVYPLSIGITTTSPEAQTAPGMTFVKGMAHQGLEMASDGIFVRVSDDTPQDRSISFREIYPALSMTPVDGIRVEDLSTASEKKKRTSSVRAALYNRSLKDAGKPARTVRYITGIVMVVLVSAVLMFSVTGGDNDADAGICSLDVRDTGSGLTLYDLDGETIDMPLNCGYDTVLQFRVGGLDHGQTVGIVTDGVAVPLQDDDRLFTLTLDGDLVLDALTPVKLPQAHGYTAKVYSFDQRMDEKSAYRFTGYIDIPDEGTTYMNDFGYVCLESDTDYFSDGNGPFYWQKVVSQRADFSDIEVNPLPRETVTISFDGDYEICDRYVTGDLKVPTQTQVTGKIKDNGSSTVVCLNNSGKAIGLALTEHKFRFNVGAEDLSIKCVPGLL